MPAARVRRLMPAPLRRAAARMVSRRRASAVYRDLDALAADGRSIIVGPWLGEVGFELLYWVPFVRWFASRYDVGAERLIVVTRGGAAAWYAPLALRTHDAFTTMAPDEFRQKNERRIGGMGEQKQLAVAALDQEIVDDVRRLHDRDAAVLHPSVMYRLFAPYWWGHQPLAWVRRHTRHVRLQVPQAGLDLPDRYTAVKFYFNDCFRSTAGNRAFVERTIAALAAEGPVISLSSGVAVDDHAPCEPDVAAMQHIHHLLTPQTNLLVQSAIVARAERFVGTYGGFAYLAPSLGVPSVGYYDSAEGFSRRHLDLALDVFAEHGSDLLDARPMETAGAGVRLAGPPRA